MADKKIQIKTFSGDNAFPVTKLENITMTAGPGLQVSGNTIGSAIAVAGTTATAVLGSVKPNGTHFTVDSNGFLTPKTATTSALGVCKFSSTYFTVSSGSVSPKVASTSQKGVVQLATTSEATTGTNTEKAVTPAGLKAALDASGNGSIELNTLTDVVNSDDIMNPYSTLEDYCILIWNPNTRKWQPSNWIKRLFSYLGSAMGSIGAPFDSNDISQNSD